MSAQTKSIHEVARELADRHKEADPDTQQVWMFEDPQGKEIRLLEVSTSVGNTGAILPFRFKPKLPDVPFPVVIILVSPEEKSDLDEGELTLPEVWGRVDQGRLLLPSARIA